MAVLSIAQLAGLWRAHGGPVSSQQIAVAVALAESGGRTDAVSASNDWGLWQINAVHFRTFGVTAQQALDPDTNAAMAVSISNHGQDWGPWCTCWANPSRDCATGSLAAPQAGSAASRELATVAAAGVTGAAGAAVAAGAAAGAPTGGTQGIDDAWSSFRDWIRRGAPDALAKVQAASDLMRRL